MPLPDQPEAKFSLGRMLATPGAIGEVGHAEILKALRRHHAGDWGELCAEDKASNEEALLVGERLFSSYLSDRGVKFWIITERDRSATTALLPSEY